MRMHTGTGARESLKMSAPVPLASMKHFTVSAVAVGTGSATFVSITSSLTNTAVCKSKPFDVDREVPIDANAARASSAADDGASSSSSTAAAFDRPPSDCSSGFAITTVSVSSDMGTTPFEMSPFERCRVVRPLLDDRDLDRELDELLEPTGGNFCGSGGKYFGAPLGRTDAALPMPLVECVDAGGKGGRTGALKNM